MVLPLLDPLRDLIRAGVGDAGTRAAAIMVTVGLGVVASGFLVAAGVVALSRMIGFPLTAVIFATLFALLALASWLTGRMLSARQSARRRAAQTRVSSDIALAQTLARSSHNVLPLIAFVAAFAMAKRF